MPSFGNLIRFLCTMENEKFLSAIESFMLRGLDERIKPSPAVHANKKPKGLKAQLDYTLETAYTYCKAGDYKSAMLILWNMLDITGPDMMDNDDFPGQYVDTIMVLDLLMSLCLLRLGDLSFGISYACAVGVNASTFIIEDDFLLSACRSLAGLGTYIEGEYRRPARTLFVEARKMLTRSFPNETVLLDYLNAYILEINRIEYHNDIDRHAQLRQYPS